MTSSVFLRAAVRSRPSTCLRSFCSGPRPQFRNVAAATVRPAAVSSFSTSAAVRSGEHQEETFEEFNSRYEREFEQVQDVFELQRNLNNSFAYDLVPSTTVITAALRAARRVNDFPTAVRIFEGIKAKVENRTQYEQYLEELEPLRKELGIELKEVMYPDLPQVA